MVCIFAHIFVCVCVFSSVVQLFSHVWFFATPWTAARQASLSITNFQSPLKLMSIKSVMPFKHLILCSSLLIPPSIFPSIRVFSNESILCIRWPKDWSFSISISPYNEYSGLISFWMDWLDLRSEWVFSSKMPWAAWPFHPRLLKSLLQHHSSKAPIL